MEQILVRNLPAGTKSALRVRAGRHSRSVEAEVRAILGEALSEEPLTMVDLLRMSDDVEIEFEPERLGVTGRTVDL